MINKILKLFTNRNILVSTILIFHVFIIALSNYLSTVRLSFLSESIFIFGFETNFPFVAALFAFPLVVVGNDVTMRVLDKKDTRLILSLARFPAIIIAVLALLAFDNPHAYRVGLASIVAYLTSTLYETYVIKKIKEKFANHQTMSMLFILISANIVQSYTFFYVAFYPYEWVHTIAFHMTIFKILVYAISFMPLYQKLLMNFVKMNKK